jgi:hypothetical protein
MTTNVSMALVDGRVLNRLDAAVDLYRQLRVDLLPQILLEEQMIMGRLDSPKELHAVLQLGHGIAATPMLPKAISYDGHAERQS